MRLSHSIPGGHRTARHGFTGRHVVLIALLIGVALLLRADEVLPVTARIPGIAILLAFSAWLLFGSLRTRPTHRG